MTRDQLLRSIAFAVAISPAIAVIPQAVPPKPSSQKKSGSFWEWILRFTGVSATPSTLKGGDDQVTEGQVWLAEVHTKACRKITDDGGYRSPILLSGDTAILAAKAENVVRLSVDSSTQRTIAKVSGLSKLIGFGHKDPSQILLLAEDDAGHRKVELLSVNDGTVAPLPYAATSSRDRQMLEELEGWERFYEAGTVYVRRETVQAMSGPVERSNVFWKQPDLDPVNVSHCELTDCGQPSASVDGSKIVFIKSLE
jgi:hypothetical protein